MLNKQLFAVRSYTEFSGFNFLHLEISLHRRPERNECGRPFQMISKLNTVNSSVI